jgi:ABC-type bacteriocin/lantibiotic exporter with double-glycine peptidase domain
VKSIFKLISLLTLQERHRLALITFAVLCASLLELVELGSLGPFMTVAADFGSIKQQPLLAWLYRTGGFQNDLSFLIILGVTVFALVLFASLFRMAVLYAAHRFTANRRYTLSVRLFRQYLYQPYQYFLNQNSGELSKNLLSEVDQVIDGVMRPAMDILVRGLLFLSILVFLIVINPAVAAMAAGIFGCVYAFLFRLIRRRITRHGQEVREANRLRFKAASEAFGGIKDVKILGKEPFFAYSYGLGAKRFAATQAGRYILSTIPSNLLQTFAIGFALALIVVLLIIHGSLTEMLPILAVYAFAIMRLTPNLQVIFQGFAQIRYYSHTVDALYRDMTTLTMPPHWLYHFVS